jgi:hypothetical protein
LCVEIGGGEERTEVHYTHTHTHTRDHAGRYHNETFQILFEKGGRDVKGI